MEEDTRNSAAWNKIRHVDVDVRTWRYIDANKIIPYYVISTVVRGWMRLSEKLDVDVDWLRLQLSPFYFSPRRRPRPRPVSFFASWANSAEIFPRVRREEERGLGIFRRLFPSASFLTPSPSCVSTFFQDRISRKMRFFVGWNFPGRYCDGYLDYAASTGTREFHFALARLDHPLKTVLFKDLDNFTSTTRIFFLFLLLASNDLWMIFERSILEIVENFGS